ncbi:MAG: type II toxin-antitoxin system Phd/YefM family antitoxin [Bacteroides sp.]|nr:type II toxin-antitoxin system Phd/YefM family antitoxin [Eubacterium sp.]MCM1419401.1 type II toxin-antitoxin system Phd/YefM family antitoxin [Roseburia sp.]MCM1463243.1 type II toxin-antitoxin system Phd/YefM family antitoxin [Bacteroides sp.]
MIQIRPISDLRNKFTEIEAVVNKGQPVYLTKNGYGTMVVMSIERYSELTDNTEAKLDEADAIAENTDRRLFHDELFDRVRGRMNEKL